jgi:hypothetical protein
MRAHKLVLIFTLVSLAAPATALADESTRAKHFEGHDSGTFWTTPTDDPNVVVSQDVTTGKATAGIGRYTLQASELINLATLEVTDGKWTMTSRKGTLHGTYAGTAAPAGDPAVITYHVTGPITGGTGRFACARGTIIFDGIANLATGALSDDVSGVLITQRRRSATSLAATFPTPAH